MEGGGNAETQSRARRRRSGNAASDTEQEGGAFFSHVARRRDDPLASIAASAISSESTEGASCPRATSTTRRATPVAHPQELEQRGNVPKVVRRVRLGRRERPRRRALGRQACLLIGWWPPPAVVGAVEGGQAEGLLDGIVPVDARLPAARSVVSLPQRSSSVREERARMAREARSVRSPRLGAGLARGRRWTASSERRIASLVGPRIGGRRCRRPRACRRARARHTAIRSARARARSAARDARARPAAPRAGPFASSRRQRRPPRPGRRPVVGDRRHHGRHQGFGVLLRAERAARVDAILGAPARARRPSTRALPASATRIDSRIAQASPSSSDAPDGRATSAAADDDDIRARRAREDGGAVNLVEKAGRDRPRVRLRVASASASAASCSLVYGGRHRSTRNLDDADAARVRAVEDQHARADREARGGEPPRRITAWHCAPCADVGRTSCDGSGKKLRARRPPADERAVGEFSPNCLG